jgi:hypothetical protein
MRTVTIKIEEGLYRRLLEEAERRRTSKSSVLREAFERSLATAPAGSVLDQLSDLVGTESGPSDLSTNKAKYLKGYGE